VRVLIDRDGGEVTDLDEPGFLVELVLDLAPFRDLHDLSRWMITVILVQGRKTKRGTWLESWRALTTLNTAGASGPGRTYSTE
jgi:hypothetical protein